MPKSKYPKRPKAPKASATLRQHQAYHERIAAWQKKCKEVDAINNQLAQAKKKTSALNGIKGYKK